MRPQHLDDLLTDFLGRPPAAGPTRVLAIDGPSGSGKTSLAARLASRRPDLPVLHMDDLYPGWDGLAQSTGLLAEVLSALHGGRPAAYRRWDWERHTWAEAHPVPPTANLVVEGVGSGGLAGAPYLSMLWWVEAPREVRMTRGIERDGEVFRPHWERWAAQEAALFAEERTRERADLRIDGAPSIDHDRESQVVLLGG